MKYIKIIILCLLVVNSSPLKADPFAVKATKELKIVLLEAIKELKDSTKEVLPEIEKASRSFGADFGLGTLKAIGATLIKAKTAIGVPATKTATAIKVGVTTVVYAPATPYIVVGVGTSYVVYRVYRYHNPTTKQQTLMVEEQTSLSKAQAKAIEAQIALEKEQLGQKAFYEQSRSRQVFVEALLQNRTVKRDRVGVPLTCQEAAFRYALASGRERVQQDVEEFNRFVAYAGA